MGGERRGHGHQRRRFQEQRHRPSLEVAQVGDDQEEKEEPQEQGFVSTSYLNHRSLRRGAFGIGSAAGWSCTQEFRDTGYAQSASKTSSFDRGSASQQG